MNAALPTREVAKPWGRERLPAPFDQPRPEKIGEIWFEPPAELDRLLVKYLFTSEKLSVQVHPSNAQTEARGLGPQGKEECWLVLDAEPGAVLGIGFREPLDAATMRAAAVDGSIEDLLVWHPVGRGDFFYIPANTVHAIGAGISLIEIQQNSDITYRLYDYGRPRELHLDEAVAVARGETYPANLHRRLPEVGAARLVDGPHFRLDRIEGAPDAATVGRYAAAPVLVIPLSGVAEIGGTEVAPGQCGVAPEIAAVEFDKTGLSLVAQPIG
jgi:mannose-6-phosphate isomerase